MAGRLFGFIKDYSYLHFGTKATQAVIEAISLGVIGIENYLVSRCVLSNHQPKKVQHDIKNDLNRYDETLELRDNDNEIV